jgi:outer membrane protein TolC/ABC-type uncharacterized transport system substrate-binding protein
MILPTRVGACLLLLTLSGNLQAAPLTPPVPVRIGILLDGDSEVSTILTREFQTTLREFFKVGADVRSETIYTGDWTPGGIRENVDRVLSDRSVDIVVALGPLSSQEICLRKELRKPVIAGVIIDADWQNLPRKGGVSGVKNLAYLNASFSGKRNIEEFSKCLSFHRLGVFISEGLLANIPQLRQEAGTRADQLGIVITYVEVGNTALTALAKLPAGVDAVYITPLLQFSSKSLDSLIAGCIARRLPTFSQTGRSEVEKGVLASYAATDDLSRRLRRIASNIQRIMSGEDAGTLPVDFSSDPHLTINMATARAIGYSPTWTAQTEAELLNEETGSVARLVSLKSCANEAASANLTLLASRKGVESGREEVRKARAPLLPQIGASASGSVVRKEVAEASLGAVPQRQLDGTIEFYQQVYDDQAWASYNIESSLQKGREFDQRGAELDISLEATSAYLNLLRAKALSRIQRSNLQLTLSNLELARVRQAVGASNMSDVIRWESQVATSRKSVLDADAKVKLAELEVNRIVNRPLDEPFRTVETSLDDSTLLGREREVFRFIVNPVAFQTLSRFMVGEGIRISPELQQLSSAMEAQARAHTAASRSFWLPTFSLQGGVTDIFAKGGVGAEGMQFQQAPQVNLSEMPDVRWNVGLKATLPIFVGLGRTAVLDQTSIELERLRIEYQAVEQSVSERVLGSLQLAVASYQGIAQASDAAIAAAKNLELVKESYSQGVVQIVTLIDAQDASLAANEGASDAVYAFLIDLMNVERAIGQFEFTRTPEEQAAFMSRLEEFFRASGIPLRR